MDLVKFLHDRLDEDEATANAAARIPGKDWDSTDGGSGRERDGILRDDDHSTVIAWFDDCLTASTHAARHDPRRVLRQVAALRSILDEHAIGVPEWWSHCRICYEVPGGDEDHSGHAPFPCPTLRALASIWSTHPDFVTLEGTGA